VPVSSSSNFENPGGHGLSGKHCSSSFIKNPGGHLPANGAHFGNAGLKRQSSSGAILCGLGCGG
jgi:hypothetical protein